jgi:hypothetical protein
MQTDNKFTKVRAKSAAVPRFNLDDQIRDALQAVPVPQNIFCHQGIAETTLDNVRRLLNVLNILEVREGCEMPEGGEYIMMNIQQCAIDAIEFAHKLVETEDEMRNAADRLALDEVDVGGVRALADRARRIVDEVSHG